MMHIIQTESVSGLRNNYDKVLKQLTSGPVLLLQRSKVAAVLMTPDAWNAVMRELDDLRDRVDVLEAKVELGQNEPEQVDIVELEAMVGDAIST